MKESVIPATTTKEKKRFVSLRGKPGESGRADGPPASARAMARKSAQRA